MKTRFYVCGLGYDVNGNITDYERTFGGFDAYEEAYARFVTVQCMDRDGLFTNAVGVNQLLLQLEECEETDEEINCIDVKNEWWVINPMYEEPTTFTVGVFNEYNGVRYTADTQTLNSKEDAITFAKTHNWSYVTDDTTGEIVWENKEEN